MEVGLGGCYLIAAKAVNSGVLILVLMEVGLGDSFSIRYEKLLAVS